MRPAHPAGVSSGPVKRMVSTSLRAWRGAVSLVLAVLAMRRMWSSEHRGLVVVTVNAPLTLGATGTLNNPGTVRAASFIDLGGTVVGNAPVLILPQDPQFALLGVRLVDASTFPA